MNIRRLMNQAGQISVEMVLMVTLTIMVAMAVSKGFRESEIFANLVSGPWSAVAGLIQNGVWGTPQDTMSKHPNQYLRISTVEGDIVE